MIRSWSLLAEHEYKKRTGMRGATWNMSIEYANVTSFRINSRSLNLSFSQNFTFSIMQAAASSSDFTMNFIYSFTGYTNTTICLQWNDTVVHRKSVRECRRCNVLRLWSNEFAQHTFSGRFTHQSKHLRRIYFHVGSTAPTCIYTSKATKKPFILYLTWKHARSFNVMYVRNPIWSVMVAAMTGLQFTNIFSKLWLVY